MTSNAVIVDLNDGLYAHTHIDMCTRTFTCSLTLDLRNPLSSTRGFPDNIYTYTIAHAHPVSHVFYSCTSTKIITFFMIYIYVSLHFKGKYYLLAVPFSTNFI